MTTRVLQKPSTQEDVGGGGRLGGTCPGLKNMVECGAASQPLQPFLRMSPGELKPMQAASASQSRSRIAMQAAVGLPAQSLWCRPMSSKLQSNPWTAR